MPLKSLAHTAAREYILPPVSHVHPVVHRVLADPRHRPTATCPIHANGRPGTERCRGEIQPGRVRRRRPCRASGRRLEADPPWTTTI